MVGPLPVMRAECITADDQRAETLDDLLSRWHHWRMGYGYGRGYNGTSSGTSDYRTSRQYDDQNGALDDAIEDGVMRQVEYETEQLPPLYRIALQVQARAIYLGCAVFSSPYLPTDREERRALVATARTALVHRLLASGVME